MNNTPTLQHSNTPSEAQGSAPYEHIEFPAAPSDRPYTYMNMVATIDGKTVSGDRGDSVVDLGSKSDHQAMNRLEASADAVLLGAQTLRATSPRWNPKSPVRIAVTRSGDIDFEAAFFSAEGSRAFVAAPEAPGRKGEEALGGTGQEALGVRRSALGAATASPMDAGLLPKHSSHETHESHSTHSQAGFAVPQHVTLLTFGKNELDFAALLRYLRTELAIERLLCLGGSETNAELLRRDLVDELFLTIAPKIKLGRELPTYAGGEPLGKDHLQNYTLVEHHIAGSEVFLRYRRSRA